MNGTGPSNLGGSSGGEVVSEGTGIGVGTGTGRAAEVEKDESTRRRAFDGLASVDFVLPQILHIHHLLLPMSIDSQAVEAVGNLIRLELVQDFLLDLAARSMPMALKVGPPLPTCVSPVPVHLPRSYTQTHTHAHKTHNRSVDKAAI